jgi:hypothetical protein
MCLCSDASSQSTSLVHWFLLAHSNTFYMIKVLALIYVFHSNYTFFAHETMSRMGKVKAKLTMQTMSQGAHFALQSHSI